MTTALATDTRKEAVELSEGIERGDIRAIAESFIRSGYCADVKTLAQAFVKIQAGKELGIEPFASMKNLHIVQGKIEIASTVMAQLVKRHPRYNYQILEHTDEVCSIQFFENGEPTGPPSVFTAADAKKAGTQNMGKFPRNMLFARAMSNGVRWNCPDVLAGLPVYTPEEFIAEDAIVAPVVTRPRRKSEAERCEEIATEPVVMEVVYERNCAVHGGFNGAICEGCVA